MKIFIALLLLLTTSVKAQLKTQVNFLQPANNPTSDTIYFKAAQPLVWKDFKGAVQQKGIAIAETSSGFGFNAGIKTINGKGTLTVNVFCYFNKSTSWVKPDKLSDYALQHEQNHFTISYIATNYFYEELRKAKFTTSNYNSLLNEIYASSMQKLRDMQTQYDGETRNGINVEQQKKWNTSINKQLASLIIR